LGEVYQAHEVAIKILPEAFAHDADRLSRFQREAKLKADFWSVPQKDAFNES